MRFTIDVTPDPEHPIQWTARCLETDHISAGMSPEVALEAVGEAIRMVLRHEAKRHGISTAEAYARIVAYARASAVDCPFGDRQKFDLPVRCW